MKDKKIVIFDLDGTLALIDKRRDLSMVDGKRDWDIFFNPVNIDLDEPNIPVINMAQLLNAQGFGIVIFSGRADKTKFRTMDWLDKHNVPYDLLQMRPADKHFMPDNELKQQWLDGLDKDSIFAVFDDRQQVVDMWRSNGLTTFQVADGDF